MLTEVKEAMLKRTSTPATITARGRGRVFARSLAAAERRVQDADRYFIKRHGAWFRPDAHGYTGDLAEAGLFVGREARDYLNTEGVVLVPIKAMTASISQEAGEHLSKAAKLTEMIENFQSQR
jgi:hypothetical protein